jgi:hypothetical protein
LKGVRVTFSSILNECKPIGTSTQNYNDEKYGDAPAHTITAATTT